MRHQQQSMGREGQTDLHRMNKMSEEKKNEVTEEVKEARKLSMEELAQVSGGDERLGHVDMRVIGFGTTVDVK